MSDIKEVRFSRRLTGYCDRDTDFLVSIKSIGTAPDISIYQEGKYNGSLTLDQRAARELINALLFLLDGTK